MKIFPAIDIKDAQVVRLKYGDYKQMSVYDISPMEAIESFAKDGAKCAHMVDLDGAKDGELSNYEVISKVMANSDLFIQVGGGIRQIESVEKYVKAGASRVILGTAAINDQDFLREAIANYGEKIAVGVDARDGKVAVAGWLETSDVDSMEFCTTLRDMGVKTIIYTDISRDGAMQGCNLDAYEKLSKIDGLDVVASGGISSLEEIAKLRDMHIYAAILGKALYTKAIDLKEALSVARRERGL